MTAPLLEYSFHINSVLSESLSPSHNIKIIPLWVILTHMWTQDQWMTCWNWLNQQNNKLYKMLGALLTFHCISTVISWLMNKTLVNRSAFGVISVIVWQSAETCMPVNINTKALLTNTATALVLSGPLHSIHQHTTLHWSHSCNKRDIF
jgi:small-conductance mechanosensitive channel